MKQSMVIISTMCLFLCSCRMFSNSYSKENYECEIYECALSKYFSDTIFKVPRENVFLCKQIAQNINYIKFYDFFLIKPNKIQILDVLRKKNIALNEFILNSSQNELKCEFVEKDEIKINILNAFNDSLFDYSDNPLKQKLFFSNIGYNSSKSHATLVANLTLNNGLKYIYIFFYKKNICARYRLVTYFAIRES